MTAIAASPNEAAPSAPALSPRLWLLALAIALLLTAAWTIRDWATLSILWLPDNDDMARLAQVRDWLGGQGFNDLLQHRSGAPGGASMHWSRIADAGIALPILLLTPLIGQHAAEVAAVIAYPAALFLAYLLLIARLAQRLGGTTAGVPALILAALAFPTISLFLPGRIDHHGLQIVLTVLLADAAVAPPSVRRGAIGGLATAASLAVGLEAAPEILGGIAAIGLAWLIGGRADDRRVLGFAGALGGATLLMLAVMRPDYWPEQWCDGFTPASTRGTLVLAGALGLMGLAGSRAAGWRSRLAVAALLGAGAAGLAWRTSGVCVAGPYGALDPFLQHVWMRNVNEARSLIGQDTFGTSIAFGGLVLLGASISIPKLRAGPGWRAFAIFLILGALASIAQVRVTYIMAGLAVVPFAVALAHAEGLAYRLTLWVLGAGISWSLIAAKLDGALSQPIVIAREVRKACVAPAGVRAVAAQPAGTIVAPLDLDSYLLAQTPHHVVASLYHRNNAGNLAMYGFFLARPDTAREIARTNGFTYVALCDDELRDSGLEPHRPGSLADLLQSGGATPAWLEPIPTGTPIRLYRVR